MVEQIQEEITKRIEQYSDMVEGLGQHLLALQKEKLQSMSISSKGSNHRDLVTEADLSSEKTIRDFLSLRFPDDGFLGEEGGESSRDGRGAAQYRWIVDPIDGTVNYAHGIPLFSISAALEHKGTIVAGVVAVPAMNEIFSAVAGQGAWLNKEKINVSQTENLKSAVVVTGFPYNREPVVEVLSATVSRILLYATGLRRTGSAALDLCWLAAGRFDAYYEAGLNPWDTAAGVLIAREAGATVTDLEGASYNPFSSKSITASNGRFHRDLLVPLEYLRDTVRAHGKL